MHQIVLLGDVDRVEACFGMFGDNVSLDTREVKGWRRSLHRLGSSFGCTRWNSKVTMVEWKHVSVCLETMLVLAQERCTVGAVRCIGLEVVLDAPDGIPRCRWLSGSTFQYVWRQC